MATTRKTNGSAPATDGLTLRTPFPPSEVKTLESKRDRAGDALRYVSIDSTIRRFLDVVPEYQFTIVDYKVYPPDEKGNWSCVVHGRLDVKGILHDGIGGDSKRDLDDCVKTALANAIKKAGHQLGVGLELWTEEGLTAVKLGHATIQAANSGDIQGVKNRVVKLFKQKRPGDPVTPEAVTQFFEITLDEFQDMAVLTKILTDNGVI